MSETSRSVVVTGAGNGIGAAIGRRLTRQSWTVVGVDLDADALSQQGYAASIVGDVGELATHEAAVAAARRLAPLHGWVNNAATNAHLRLDEIPLESIDRILRTTLLSVIYGSRVAVQEFLAADSPGAIVNISSIHARAGFPSSPIYDAAKAGVEGLTRQLCVEYAHAGIRVNAIAPGFVLSRPDSAQLKEPGRRERINQTWAPAAPRGTIMVPDEIAGPAAFLLSDDANGINGHVLAVDGGMAARVIRVDTEPIRSSAPTP